MRENSATPPIQPRLAPLCPEPVPPRDPASDIAGFPASLDWTAGRTGEKPLPGRVPWMEVVSDCGQTSTSSDQQRLFPASRHSEVSQADIANPALSLSGLIHDARNLATTLDLYCDLLDTPGVLTPSCHHYAGELRLIAGGSRRILERLAATELTCTAQIDVQNPSGRRDSDSPVLNFPMSPSAEKNVAPNELRPEPISKSVSESTALGQPAERVAGPIPQRPRPGSFQQISDTVERFSRGARWKQFVSPQPVTSLAGEVLANHSLLCALAGHGITVGLSLYGGKRPLDMSADDLTRILINLTKNATEAMPQGGHIQISVEEFSDHLCLNISDSGCGIPESAREEIFTAGYTTHVGFEHSARDSASRRGSHRGLGLAIVRSLVAAAGGSVTAANRGDLESQQSSPSCVKDATISGAIFSLNFPIRA